MLLNVELGGKAKKGSCTQADEVGSGVNDVFRRKMWRSCPPQSHDHVGLDLSTRKNATATISERHKTLFKMSLFLLYSNASVGRYQCYQCCLIMHLPVFTVVNCVQYDYTSTRRFASHAFFAKSRRISSSPLVSHMPLNEPPFFCISSQGCAYSMTSPLSSTSTLS